MSETVVDKDEITPLDVMLRKVVSGKAANAEKARAAKAEKHLRLIKASAKKMKMMKELAIDGKGLQHCIDGAYVENFLRLIPSTVRIEFIRISIRTIDALMSLPIPQDLAEAGIKRARKKTGGLDIHGTFVGLNAKSLKSLCSKISRTYDRVPLARMMVDDVLLGENGAFLRFKFARKYVREATEKDRRKKIAVLGLESISRDPKLEKKAINLLSRMGDQTYECSFRIEEKRITFCKKIGSK
jgi:hypothetical protein